MKKTIQLRGEPLSGMQIVRLLGGLLNTLLSMSNEETIRTQLKYMAESEELWSMLRGLNKAAITGLEQSGFTVKGNNQS